MDGTAGVRVNGSEIQPEGLSAPVTDDQTGSSPAIPVERIFQTDRCNLLTRGGFIWFTESVSFNDWISPLDAGQAEQVRSKIDFSKQGVLLVDFGVAGSKAAGATVIDDQLEIKGQEGLVKVMRVNPPADNRTAQVVTHPCTLFVMPRSGYSSLVVLSEQDDRLISFDN